MKKMQVVLLSSVFAAVLAGCGSSPTAEQSGAPVESRVATVNAGGVNGINLPRELTDPGSVLSKRSIYFDLDSYTIKSEQRDLVAAHAKFMVKNPQFKVLLQGNTDERGSSEYNLSLGQKRSDALKKALVLLGVSESQIETVSLGKEKPRNEGHDESAWAENRRADILYAGEF
ncbi:MAG: peptidoglycan-associated lipoprotein Pal [Pseudomonadota bacterium]|jgi:peptidoglycan-associated lipoprotein